MLGAVATAAAALLAACGLPGQFGNDDNVTSPLPQGAGSAKAKPATAPVPARPTATAAPAGRVPMVIVRPPDPRASGLVWFDPSPPRRGDGSLPGPGFWRRDAPGRPWQWTGLPAGALTEQTAARPITPKAPPWPADASALRAVRVTTGGGAVVGYWVWNTARFVGAMGAHRWSPRWDWVGDDRAYLLVAAH
jgi:hypothetical protein